MPNATHDHLKKNESVFSRLPDASSIVSHASPVRCHKYTRIPSTLICAAFYWQPLLKMSKLIRALMQPRLKCCASAFFFLTSLVIYCCASDEYVAPREAMSVLKADVTVSNVSFSYLTDSGPLEVTLSPSTAILTGPTTIAALNSGPPGVSHTSHRSLIHAYTFG